MKKNHYWLVAIENIIIMLCWTFIAFFSQKWWVALFAILCMRTFKTKSTYSTICDGCGRILPYMDSPYETFKAMKEAGWVRKKNGDKWEDYCPECQKKMHTPEEPSWKD